MAIDFSNEAVLYNGGQRIPIDTQAEYEDAWRAVQQVYSAQGLPADGDALGDMENRIRGGQTLDQIIAGAYDDAKRRAGNAGRSDATDTSRDAQANAGAQYAPPAGYVQTVVSSVVTPQRQAAAAVTPQAQLSTVLNPGRLAGPAPTAFGASQYVSPAGGGGLGMWLMLGGAAVLLFVLGRKFL